MERVNRAQRHFTSIGLISACLLAVHALNLTGKYSQGPVDLGDHAKFWYDVDIKARIVHLALKITDKASVNNAKDANWLGLGVSEPTSGSMLGSDIVTGEFLGGETEKCTIKDRYVPFAAYPLVDNKNQSPAVYPKEDTCQADDSWKLVRCGRDVNIGEMVLEVTRSLDAHDAQDRPIGPNQQNIIFAYGSSFAYHGSARGSRQISLYDNQGSVIDPKTVNALPADVSAKQNLVASQYHVPSDGDTTYACTSVIADLGPNGRRMVVAADPLLKTKSGKILVHHLIVHACQNSEYFRGFSKTQRCGYKTEVPGPTGYGNCSNVIYGWASGGSRLVMPPEAGALLTNQNKYLIMETHYNNADLVTDSIDESGVILYYTDKLRPNEAGTLNTGDPFVSLIRTPVVSGKKYTFTCPSQCTEMFKEPVNIFGGFLHMHWTGHEIFENKFSKNGTFLEQINAANYWSNNFQVLRMFNPVKKLNPGESLSLTCVYDTTKVGNTVFGLRTKDEMCVEFLFYWPVQKRRDTNDSIHICGFVATNKSNTGGLSFCGNGGNFEKGILPVPNPSINDSIGSPDKFGSQVKTCIIAESSSSSSGKEATCFPNYSTVTMQDGSEKLMRDLKVGDMVLVAPGTYSSVFMFTHNIAEKSSEFVRISTVDGFGISLSMSHYLYVNGLLKQARFVRVGDFVTLSCGRASVVNYVGIEVGMGLYNPQTLHGDIVVSGIIASTYTSAIEPPTAHALLAPLRSLFVAFGASTSVFEQGADNIVNLLSKLSVL